MGCGASKLFRKPGAVIEPLPLSSSTRSDADDKNFGRANSHSNSSASAEGSAAPTRVASVETAATTETDAGDIVIGGNHHLISAAASATAGYAAGSAVSGDGSLAELGKATGEALIEVAKTLPIVAPVAFLICGIASCAVSAVVLKNDCMQFVRVLNTVEQILLQAQNLQQANAAINDVRDILEEALALMNAVQDRGWLTSTFLAKTEKNRFEDLKNQLQEALGRLSLASTVEMSALQHARFDQIEQMKTRLSQLGGPEAVLNDPAALREMEKAMEASDRLVMAAVERSREELVTVGSQVQLTRQKTMQIAREQRQLSLVSERSFHLQQESSAKLDKQDEKLEQMTQSQT